jgi:hypothetical protein
LLQNSFLRTDTGKTSAALESLVDAVLATIQRLW